MNNISLFRKIMNLVACILVFTLLAACNSSQPVEEVTEESPAEVVVPESPDQEVGEVEPAQESEPPSEIDSSQTNDVLHFEDLIYPGAEFLFEVDGLGGAMTPWRFYAIPNDSSDKVADYYREKLSWFVVENDEVIEGISYLMMAHPEPLGFLNEVEGFDEIAKVSASMNGYLLGVEVTHSEVGAGLNRLGMALEMHDIADQIPTDTIILVLDYFKNIY